MSLWIIILAGLLLGSICVTLIQRRADPGSARSGVIHTPSLFLGFVAGMGLLVAFNIFHLDLVDSFFQDTRWYVYRILYWPAAVLAFLPLLFGGLLVLAARVHDATKRIRLSLVLLAATLLAYEATAILDDRPLTLTVVQLVVFGLFSALVWRRR
jgi:hypothetical protein